MKYIYRLLICGLLFTVNLQMQAQLVIGSGADLVPDKDAILDLRSGGNKGLLLPRLMLEDLYSSAPLSKHAAGMVIYNQRGSSIPEGYYFNDGTQWIQIVDTQVYSWYSTTTKTGAESNADDIYQMGGVSVGEVDLEPHTKFMVASGDKGALLPRLSNTQIENITSRLSLEEKKRIDGLLVYNSSINCFSFFNSEALEWKSLCYETPPAGMSVECTDCKALGNYKAFVNLTNDNFYRIKIRVNTPGAYAVRIETENEYSFAQSGTFDNVGIYTIDVPGSGVPEKGGIDDVTVYLNEEKVADAVLEPITVESATASYQVLCNGGTPGTLVGEYSARQLVNGNTHYITIDIEVVRGTGESIVVETDNVNGIEFQSDPITLGEVGSVQTVILRANGTPSAAGSFSYTPTSTSGDACPFTVEVKTNLGTFADPAKSCLAIYNTGVRTDGEYWIKESSGSSVPVKTRCDMTNGGYTLIYSFSEGTAYRETVLPYGRSANSIVMNSDHHLNMNIPRNVIKRENETINYKDFRLSLNTMKNIKENNLGKYKVQIAYDPQNANDEWAKRMYAEIEARAGRSYTTYDFISGSDSNIDVEKHYNLNGSIFGVSIYTKGDYVYFDKYPVRDNPNIYNSTHNATYIDFGYDFDPQVNGKSKYLWTVELPKHPEDGGGFYTYSFNTEGFNNMFGWFGEHVGDHQFGKCVVEVKDVLMNDDYTVNATNSSTYRCDGDELQPHSFNNGEGRYLQWWVK